MVTKQSVDEKIAQETHAVYEFVHKQDKRTGIANNPLTRFVRTNPRMAALGIVIFMVVVTPVAFMVSNNAGKEQSIAKDDSETAAIDESGVYSYGDSDDVTGDDTDQTDGSTSSDATGSEITKDSNGTTSTSSEGSSSTSAQSSSGNTSSNGSASTHSSGGTGSNGTPNEPATTPPHTNNPSSGGTGSHTPKIITINAVSWNHAHFKPGDVESGLKSLSKVSDVIGLQEFGPSSQRDSLKHVVKTCASCGYAMYMPSLDDGGNTPIVWKKARFKLLGTGHLQAYDGPQKVEDGAGGTQATAKHVIWVYLQERKSGKKFYFMNTHLIPTVESNGHPITSKPRRLALYKKHINALASKANTLRKRAPVLITGDFNVNYRRDKVVKASMFPYATLGKVSIWANWRYLGMPKEGTHDKRLIDYVFASRQSHVVPTKQKILPTYGSDHHALQVTFRLK